MPNKCPNCGGEIGQRWSGAMTFKDVCVERTWVEGEGDSEGFAAEGCGYESASYPTPKITPNTRHPGPCYHYEYGIVDGHGYVRVYSRGYSTPEERDVEAAKDLVRFKPEVYGDCRAILWNPDAPNTGTWMK